MEDIKHLSDEISKLRSNYEIVLAERNALEQTVLDILRANIQLKAGAAILENKLNMSAQLLELKEKENKKLIEDNEKSTENNVDQ